MPKQERGLGRGLDALFAGAMEDGENHRIIEIDLKEIVARADQPRRKFEQESLQELAESLKEHGVLQPLLVRKHGKHYEIIAGERRWRAAEMAGIEKIPVLVKEIDDIEAAEISLIENLQREDLSLTEEARAYRQMIERYGYTQELLSRKIGKSRTHVTNTMRIMNLPEAVLNMIDSGKISAGHARALLSLGSAEQQIVVAKQIVEQGLSVRAVEEKARQKKTSTRTVKRVEIIDLPDVNASDFAKRNPEIVELEERMQERWGTKVDIKPSQQGGKILISYYNDEDLSRIIDLLGL
ncbi:MAG: ParB/RepB/Spo0J family partition protein [Deltaproteobacteria bacterium]